MTNVLKGKVALVTAGSAGLGEAAARALACEGMRVVINYSASKECADDVRGGLFKRFPDNYPPQPDNEAWRCDFGAINADLGNRADITRLVEETIALMGRLDVVVSNAVWTRFSNFANLEDEIEEAVWDRCFNMNVKSHLWLIHAAKKYLDITEGAFITTASLAGVIPGGSSLAYAVTKAAQIHLVKSLATIVGPKIRCNSVSPAMLFTDLGRKFSDEKLAAATEESKLKRRATVEDVADQIVLFAKSRSVTGTNAVFDCGFSL